MEHPTAYPRGEKADWPLRIPAGTPDGEIARLRERAGELADTAQYGWGHTIDFGPFRQEGLLGEKYRRIAGVFDEWGWWPADLAGLEVADVGCFTGGLSALAAARGAKAVHAVDELADHVAQAELVAEAFGLDTVTTRQASLYGLDAELGPERFDLVLLAGVLYHVSDMLVALIVCQRLLKPGGTLLLESNAVECFDHSYANYGRYFGGMWWQPTALCLADVCEHAGFARPDVAFYQPGRALARAAKPAEPRVPFTRGVNYPFADRRDEAERSLDPQLMAPAPCRHAEAGMIGRWAGRAAERALQAPMAAGYAWRRRTRRSRSG